MGNNQPTKQPTKHQAVEFGVHMERDAMWRGTKDISVIPQKRLHGIHRISHNPALITSSPHFYMSPKIWQN